MTEPIVLFDVPTASKSTSISPNVWKIRYALNHKKIAYRTEWVEFPDIENKCRSIGALPTAVRDDRPLYTLPVIYDPSTGFAISDSAVIAEYLDATYPDTPKLMPLGTDEFFQQEFLIRSRIMMRNIVQFTFPATERMLSPSSQRYYKTAISGSRSPCGIITRESLPTEWEKVQADFNAFAVWLYEHEAVQKDGPYILGEKVSFLDFVLGGHLFWVREALGEESKEWNDISTWNDGKFGAISESLRKYEIPFVV
ncbi:hypothetical protein H0H93_005969 [Arthromyces matolae]|nr:hypothetical protein H0H93_005969 [Arthromyces matolae]